jgi:soluble lytic murein transglycosylase-like protein
MRALPALATGFALLFSAAQARADIFQFTDSDGVVHYTNVQPRNDGQARWRKVYRSDDTRRASTSSPTGLRAPDPDRVRQYGAHIREAAALYQLPEAFLRAIVLVESNFFPDAISQAGAIGLMQLMPSTAVNMGVLDAFDPRQNVLGGARFLRMLANRFNGDLVLTVAAYNAGEAAIKRYNGVPPYQETRRYVKRVLHHYYAFRNGGELAMADTSASPAGR